MRRESTQFPNFVLLLTMTRIDDRRKANATVQCPVKKGQYIVEQTADLPKEIPPGSSIECLLKLSDLESDLGKFTIDVRGYSVNDDDLVCLKLVADFRRFPHFW